MLFAMMGLMYPDQNIKNEYRERANWWCLAMFLSAVLSFIVGFG
jgi:hypothetical protein